jgi:hypothetical protein
MLRTPCLMTTTKISSTKGPQGAFTGYISPASLYLRLTSAKAPVVIASAINRLGEPYTAVILADETAAMLVAIYGSVHADPFLVVANRPSNSIREEMNQTRRNHLRFRIIICSLCGRIVPSQEPSMRSILPRVIDHLP